MMRSCDGGFGTFVGVLLREFAIFGRFSVLLGYPRRDTDIFATICRALASVVFTGLEAQVVLSF